LSALPCPLLPQSFTHLSRHDCSWTDHQVFSLPPVNGTCYVHQLPCSD
jgi:hypothetical protein